MLFNNLLRLVSKNSNISFINMLKKEMEKVSFINLGIELMLIILKFMPKIHLKVILFKGLSLLKEVLLLVLKNFIKILD